MEALSLTHASKAYGRVEALRDVTFAVGQGEVVALLGPNGAGKTTALALLTGLRRPDRGVARLLGSDPTRPAARTALGVVPQELGFPGGLRVRELLQLTSAHFPAPTPLALLLERFGLVELERRQAGGLSGGERRRLALALAFAGDPQVVLLDEPTAALDVEGRRAVWSAVRAFAGAGRTVLLTTHYLEEAEALASRVVVLDRGRVLADGSVAEIKARAHLTRVRVRAGDLPAPPAATRVALEDGVATIYTTDAARVVRWLVHRELPLDGLEVAQVTLEEALAALAEGYR